MSIGQVAAAVAAVLILAGLAWRRRRLGIERVAVGLLVAAALGIYASGVLSALPDPKEVVGDVANALGAWTYALVGVMAFLETGAFVGLVAPGETVVIAGGVIAGQGEIDLIPLIGLVWVCAVLGDTTSFFIGRRLGRGFLERNGPRVKITPERLEQVEDYFERHGGKTILIGRFIGLVRALAPFIAGSSGLAYKRFIPFSIVGCGLWATAFCVLGYIFWRSFDQVAHIAGQAVFGFGVTVTVIVVVVVAYRRRTEIAAWFVAHRDHPLMRPLAAVAIPLYRGVLRPIGRFVGPQVRFVWNRVTPGQLGLELTTVLAISGVGLYVFVLYLVVLSGDLGSTGLDDHAFELADRLYSQTLVDVAKLVTDLGAFPTVAALVAAAIVFLGLQRRFSELLVLVFGLALVYVAVHVTKGAVDRPRPAGALLDVGDAAYPSGHAAYSTAWIAVALIVARGRVGLAGNAALVTVAAVIAAAVGASRVYLHVHYWSDVLGGWGLGVGIFGALGVIAMVVDHIRHNEAARSASSAAPSAPEES